MDNFSDILNKIMSDPAIMNTVSEIASSVSGASAPPEQTVETPPDAENAAAGQQSSLPFDIGSLLGSLGGTPSVESSSRAELLRALKPFVNSHRSAQIDRALSMLNTAYTARTAIKAFGGKKLF